MSKYDKRLEARSLRAEGVSVVAIAKKLSVSKSSVSLWCRDILLTSKQIEELRKQKGSVMGRWMGAESNRKKKINAIQEANYWAEQRIKKISKRELLLIGTALYWSEGSKTDSTSGFVFVNSDPEMIFTMKLFLINIMTVPPEDIVCSIQINKIHEQRIGTVLNFWKKLLSLQDSQVRKPYYVNTQANKVYANYENYYGVCRLIVRRSKKLKYKMLGLVKEIKNHILSA